MTQHLKCEAPPGGDPGGAISSADDVNPRSKEKRDDALLHFPFRNYNDFPFPPSLRPPSHLPLAWKRGLGGPRHIGEVVGVAIDTAMRAPTADEVDELREMWWRHRRDGIPLPAEAGVIAVEGERQ